jgi:hypothetical protein
VFRLALEPSQLHIEWVLGALPLGAKWLGYEADHSLPFNATVKNRGAIPPLPHSSLWHDALSIKHWGSFTMMEEYELQVLENKMLWKSTVFGRRGIKVNAQFKLQSLF